MDRVFASLGADRGLVRYKMPVPIGNSNQTDFDVTIHGNRELSGSSGRSTPPDFSTRV